MPQITHTTHHRDSGRWRPSTPDDIDDTRTHAIHFTARRNLSEPVGAHHIKQKEPHHGQPFSDPLGRSGPPGRDRSHRHSSSQRGRPRRAGRRGAGERVHVSALPPRRHRGREARGAPGRAPSRGAARNRSPARALAFGVATPEDVRAAIEAGAAGAISGSAVVRRIEAALPDVEGAARAVAEFVREMKAATRK